MEQGSNAQNKLAGFGLVVVLVAAAVWGISQLPGALSRDPEGKAQVIALPTLVIEEIPGLALNTRDFHYPMRAASHSLFAFRVRNNTPVESADASIKIGSVSVYVTSTPADANYRATPTLKNFRLKNLDTGVTYGTTVLLARVGPTAQEALVTFSGLSITVTRGSSVRLLIQSDVASLEGGALSGSGHGVKVPARMGDAYSIVGAGTTSGRAAGVSGLAVTHFNKMIYAGVVQARLNSASPSGLQAPSVETVIARFNLWRHSSYSRIPYIAGYFGINFEGTMPVTGGKVLRLYHTSLSPLNLLGSSTLTSQNPLRWAGMNLTRRDITQTSGTPLLLIMTLDTRDARAGHTLRAIANVMNWFDTLNSVLRPQEMPIRANEIRF